MFLIYRNSLNRNRGFPSLPDKICAKSTALLPAP
ncbi:unknown [[Mannheimia] succiniciproducens MBEL55E]|uniref:Uncharacterized protein n=1 Tax=Mannheimia succiniciproducens (strain KCTC 0769BP / MBEL55E) TaxID=221988 RepID=Q65TJ3_MANSM|nr:unknown [[Mannheimia] succiniciproducens MBEL55E]